MERLGIHVCRVFGTPVPWKANRRAKDGAITSWQGVVGWDVKRWMATARDGHRFPVAGRPLAVECVILIPKPDPWDGREFPIAHGDGDADNYGKAIRDACQGILWEEDCIIINSSDLLLWAQHEYANDVFGNLEAPGCYVLFTEFTFYTPVLRRTLRALDLRLREKE